MLKNADITVITEKNGEYYLNFFSGVSFVGKTAKTASEKGLFSADFFTLRIPASNGAIFVSAKEWKAADGTAERLLTEDGECLCTEDGERLCTEGEEIWTLIPNKTYIVRGTVSGSELESIQKLLSTRECYTVMSVSDNRLLSPAVSHIRCDVK